MAIVSLPPERICFIASSPTFSRVRQRAGADVNPGANTVEFAVGPESRKILHWRNVSLLVNLEGDG